MPAHKPRMAEPEHLFWSGSDRAEAALSLAEAEQRAEKHLAEMARNKRECRLNGTKRRLPTQRERHLDGPIDDSTVPGALFQRVKAIRKDMSRILELEKSRDNIGETLRESAASYGIALKESEVEHLTAKALADKTKQSEALRSRVRRRIEGLEEALRKLRGNKEKVEDALRILAEALRYCGKR